MSRTKPLPRVAVVKPTHAPQVQFVSQLNYLRALRDFYIKGKGDAFKHISAQIQNERCRVHNEVGELKLMLDNNSQMLEKLEERQQIAFAAVKSARDNVRQLKLKIQGQNLNEDIQQLQKSLQASLKEYGT